MQRKKLIFFSICTSIGFTISYYSIKKILEVYDFIKFCKNDDKIIYTTSESKQIINQNPQQKYIFLQGHILPTQNERFLLLKTTVKQKNSNQKITQQMVQNIQLMDHITQSDQLNIFFQKDTQLLPSLYDYKKSQQYNLQTKSFFQRIKRQLTNKLFGKQKYPDLFEQQEGIQFGQHVTMLCQIKNNELNAISIGSQSITDEILNTLDRRQRYIFGALFGLFMQIPFYLTIGNILINHYKNYKQQQQEPLLQKSVSVLLNSQNEDDACTICFTKIRSVILEPCLHLAICQVCSDKLQKQECPICRNKIENRIKVLYQQ